MPTRIRSFWPLAVAVAVLLAASPAEAADRFYAGGGVGFGFGDVEFVDISGVFAYHVVPRVTTGVRLLWRSREDSRFAQDLETDDYGAAIFARFFIKRPFFLHGEVERLSWEYINADLSTTREGDTNVFVGGGVAHPLAPKVSLVATVLYNLTYDSSDLRQPYDSPWVLRAGVGVSF